MLTKRHPSKCRKHVGTEGRTDIRAIQLLLGHKKLDTTALYMRVAIEAISKIVSPLDLLPVTEVKPPPA